MEEEWFLGTSTWPGLSLMPCTGHTASVCHGHRQTQVSHSSGLLPEPRKEEGVDSVTWCLSRAMAVRVSVETWREQYCTKRLMWHIAFPKIHVLCTNRTWWETTAHQPDNPWGFVLLFNKSLDWNLSWLKGSGWLGSFTWNFKKDQLSWSVKHLYRRVYRVKPHWLWSGDATALLACSTDTVNSGKKPFITLITIFGKSGPTFDINPTVRFGKLSMKPLSNRHLLKAWLLSSSHAVGLVFRLFWPTKGLSSALLHEH